MKTLTILGLLLGTLSQSSLAGQGVEASWPHFSRILVLPDTSGSLDATEYAAVVSSLGGQLVDLAIDLGARDVGLLPWAGSGDVLRSAHWVRLPARPVIAPTVVQFTEGESVFRGPQEQRKAREARLTATRSTAADSCFRLKVQTAVEPLCSRLAGSSQGHSAETDVTGALGRCRHEPAGTLCLLITDARQEGVEAPARVAEPRAGNCTIVILVPTREHGMDSAASVGARTQWLHEIAPWARVLMSFEITSAPEEWILPLLQDELRPGIAQTAGFGGPR